VECSGQRMLAWVRLPLLTPFFFCAFLSLFFSPSTRSSIQMQQKEKPGCRHYIDESIFSSLSFASARYDLSFFSLQKIFVQKENNQTNKKKNENKRKEKTNKVIEEEEEKPDDKKKREKR
jgi:hypothetical protein